MGWLQSLRDRLQLNLSLDFARYSSEIVMSLEALLKTYNRSHFGGKKPAQTTLRSVSFCVMNFIEPNKKVFHNTLNVAVKMCYFNLTLRHAHTNTHTIYNRKANTVCANVSLVINDSLSWVYLVCIRSRSPQLGAKLSIFL